MTGRPALAPPQIAPVRRPEHPHRDGGPTPGAPDAAWTRHDAGDPPGWLAPAYQRMKSSTLPAR